MEHPRRPGIATRVRARLRGERTAGALEALRSAGIGIDIELSRAEQVRAQLAVDGQTLWDCPRSVSSHLLATWNAFLLQTLAAGMLDADYQADRGTVGFVPPVTFEQVWAWFSAAEGWLSMAQQAGANPDYNIAAAVHLPAALPAWVAHEPCPPAHLRALLLALPAIRERADLAVYDLAEQAADERQRQAVNALRQLAAEAGAALDYGRTLHVSPAGAQLHELIEAHLKRAVGLWFHIGQLAAMPSMIGGYRPKTGPGRVDPESVPGGARFDRWCLTDPQTLAQWQGDPKAREAIDALWAADPDPVRTLTIQAQIKAALDSGAIAPVTGSGQGSYYYGCPWPPIYQVRRRLKINGKRLSAAQRFTYEVSAEELPQGGQFVRHILLGPFTTTTEVDYGRGD
jgi:hypothetical protein